MKRIVFLPILLVAGMLASGCDSGNGKSNSMEELHRQNGIPVRMAIVGGGRAADLQWDAVLTGGQESSASAMVADRVETILFKVGDHVSRDAVVVRFPSDNPAASFNQARVAFEHSRATLQRMEALYQSGGISLQELDNIRTQHLVAKANWEAANDAVNVGAPIDGIITQINVTASQNVKSGDVLFTVADTRSLRARLLVTESVVRTLSVGDAATAEYRGETLEGRIDQVDRSMESKKQAYGVMVAFENPGRRVASGSNARIRIRAQRESATILIERKDLQREDDSYFVYLADGDKAVRRPVTIGGSIDTRVEILSGLKNGDRLITASQMMLENGSHIRVVEN